MPPTNQVPAVNISILKDLRDLQTALYDKASAYTKLIMGLGYGGFFLAWSGTRPYLSPRLLVASALLVTVSLVLYILFEVCQTMVGSYLSIEFAGAVNKPDGDVADALRTYKMKAARLTSPLLRIWKVVFPLSVLTGLAGAGILVYAFVGSLARM
jgi:hypothetical protein